MDEQETAAPIRRGWGWRKYVVAMPLGLVAGAGALLLGLDTPIGHRLIADVLAVLAQSGAWLARMSGSGATCLALYDNPAAMQAAAARIAADHPGWWQMQGSLR